MKMDCLEEAYLEEAYLEECRLVNQNDGWLKEERKNSAKLEKIIEKLKRVKRVNEKRHGGFKIT
jgi:hypothetical protein